MNGSFSVKVAAIHIMCDGLMVNSTALVVYNISTTKNKSNLNITHNFKLMYIKLL